MRKYLLAVALAGGIVGLGAFFWLAQPRGIGAADLPAHVPDLANGATMYHAGGCISCHKPPKGAVGLDPTLPSGGSPLTTPIGIFYPPNITPDMETGIGAWTSVNFVNAMQHGVSPQGTNYIPAFPYTSYGRMKIEDVLDLQAYLKSLKPVGAPRREAEIPLSWLVRMGVGVWKHLALKGPIESVASESPSWNRGRYLVMGAGHCVECHTPRNFLMIGDETRFLAGGPHPEGKGKVSSLIGLIERKKYTDTADLASALKDGESVGYDGLSSGGMGEVQANIAKLPDSDIQALAEFLASLKK